MLVLVGVAGGLVFLCILAVGLLFFRLQAGPVFLDIKSQIVSALETRVGHGYRFNLDGTAIEESDRGPVLTFYGLSVADAGKRRIVSAPNAAVAVDPLALMVGRVAPSRLEVSHVDLRLVVRPDGAVAVSAGSDAVAMPLGTTFAFDPVAATGNGVLRALSAAMRSLIDLAIAPDSPLTALQRIEVSGRMVLDDQLHQTTTAFNNAKLVFAHEADGAPTLSVAADGSAGRWSLAARAAVAEDGTKLLKFSADSIPIDTVATAGGFGSTGFDLNIPLSAQVDVHIGTDGEVETAAGNFRLGPGSLKLDDPGREPIPIDAVTGDLHLDKSAGALVLDRAEVHGATAAFTLSGRAALPRGPGDPWVATLDSAGAFAPERPGEEPIVLDHVGLSFHYMPSDTHLVLDSAVATGPSIDFSANADIRDGPDGLRLHGTSGLRHLPLAFVIRLLPVGLAGSARAWLLANLKSGVVDNSTGTADLDDADFAAIRAGRPVADNHLRVDFGFSGVSLALQDGAPPVSGVAGTGVMTDRALAIQVKGGTVEIAPGRQLSLADAAFRVPLHDSKPTPPVVDAHVTGALDVAASLVGPEALKPYADLPFDPGKIHGQIDAHVSAQLLVGSDGPPRIGAMTATADATDVTVDQLVGKEGLTGGALKLYFDTRSGLQGKGEARVMGAPVAVQLSKPMSGPGEATVFLMADDAARAKAGVDVAALKGPVAAKVSVPLAPGGMAAPTIDVDLTRAGIETPVPGFRKPAGRPAHATLTVVQRDDGVTLDNLSFEGNGAVVRGAVDLDRDGGLVSAKLAEVRLSPGDDMQVEAQKSDDGLKVVAEAASLDARPFLKGLPDLDSMIDKGALDLQLRSASIRGQNGQTMSQVDLHLSLRGKDLQQLRLTGRVGRQPLTVETMQTRGSPHLAIHAGDAGACLLFMDVYKKMAGGRLDAEVAMTRDRTEGYASVQDFTVRDDAAASKLAAEGRLSRKRDSLTRGLEAPAPDTSAAMSFQKVEARFAKSGEIVQVRDGSVLGSAFNATVAGTVDLSHDQISLAGVATPIFGPDSMLSILGNLRLNYSVTGSAANPTLNINGM